MCVDREQQIVWSSTRHLELICDGSLHACLVHTNTSVEYGHEMLIVTIS